MDWGYVFLGMMIGGPLGYVACAILVVGTAGDNEEIGAHQDEGK